MTQVVASVYDSGSALGATRPGLVSLASPKQSLEDHWVARTAKARVASLAARAKKSATRGSSTTRSPAGNRKRPRSRGKTAAAVIDAPSRSVAEIAARLAVPNKCDEKQNTMVMKAAGALALRIPSDQRRLFVCIVAMLGADDTKAIGAAWVEAEGSKFVSRRANATKTANRYADHLYEDGLRNDRTHRFWLPQGLMALDHVDLAHLKVPLDRIQHVIRGLRHRVSASHIASFDNLVAPSLANATVPPGPRPRNATNSIVHTARGSRSATQAGSKSATQAGSKRATQAGSKSATQAGVDLSNPANGDGTDADDAAERVVKRRKTKK